jgi:hypothetical protein
VADRAGQLKDQVGDRARDLTQTAKETARDVKGCLSGSSAEHH